MTSAAGPVAAPYRCRNNHVGQRGPDGGCMRCRADASKRYRERQVTFANVDYGQMAATSYRDEPKSLAEADAREERRERRRAAREETRKVDQ